MFRNEMYKLFVKQKIWIFIAILFVLKIATVCITGYDSHYMIDENEKYYNEYMKKYEGKISQNTKKEIEKEYENLSLSDNEILASEQKNKAFQIIYDQYNYQKEKGSGYILETRGWQSILEHDDIDFCLVVCILIVVTVLWENEYETEMDVILRSCKKGKYAAPFAKVIIGVIVSAILSILFQLIQIIYLIGTVGLKHSDYPIQSLEYFQNTQYHISLGKAVLIVSFIRLTGVILMALVFMLLNIEIKRKTVSMIVGIAMILLAEIIFQRGNIIYYMPLPIGALKGVGYLWPAQFEFEYIGDEHVKVCTFNEIPTSDFIIMMIVYFAEIVLFSGGCILFFSKKKIGKADILKRLKKTVGCLLISVLILTGCSGGYQNITVSIKKDDTQTQAEWNGKRLEIDHDNNNIVLKNKNGKDKKLIRNVFPSELNVQKIFVYENNCYYLSENDESAGVCIRKLNLKNYDNTLIYDSTDENIEDYFGIIQKKEQVNKIFDEYEDTKWFFVTDDYIFWKKKYYIEQVNIKKGNKKIIAENVSDDDIIYKNGDLKYKNAEGKIVTIKL